MEQHNINTNTYTVINISNVPLSVDPSLKRLFWPKLSHIDEFQLKEDVKQFTKRARLREFFNNLEATTENIEMDLIPDSG